MPKPDSASINPPGTASVPKRFRYPGPESFRDDEIDRRLFFGRDEDAAEMFNRVLSSRLLVLYAKSGLGKTSLLQAGLFPRLRAEGALPIRVRFNRRNEDPLDTVREAVSRACKTHGIAFTPGQGETLWEYFNTALFSLADRFLSPILVLDQFEEVFTLHGRGTRLRLAEELGYLISGAVPPAVQRRLRSGGKLPYSVQPPNVRLLLSLREEYVGALQEFAAALPGILGNRYRLVALDRLHARTAIENPAHLSNAEGLLATRPFDYAASLGDIPGTVDEMLDFLESRHGEIEPFQLQMLCRHAEQQVAARQAAGESRPSVDLQTYFGGRKGMETVLRQFYRKALEALPGWRMRRRAATLCEEGLLSPEGYRESLGQGQIRRSYGLSEEQLGVLVDRKVLRREDRLDSFSYELSHDSLAKAVHASRQSRQRTRRLLISAMIVLIGGSGGWQWWEARKAEIQAQAKLAEYGARLRDLVERDMVPIPAGTFQMGSLEGETDETPVRTVTVKAFRMGRFEVTFEEYDEFAASTGRPLPDDGGWGRGRRPVINVAWEDAVAYAKWLSEKTGRHYRLPTEAEWEYTARAETSTLYWWGNNLGKNRANCGGCGSQWDNKQTALVGSFPTNPWGIHDSAGNVWEWVADCYHKSYQGASADGRTPWEEPNGCGSGTRVIRGGSWYSEPDKVRSATRYMTYPDDRNHTLGFRLARDP